MTSNTLSKPASFRRTRYAVQTFAFLFAVTACCVLAGVLGDRFPRRIDATATREHELAPSTKELLGSLTGEYELVVAANFSGLDPTSARRTQDVLDNFARATDRVRTTVLDVSSARGVEQLDGLLDRLAKRFGPELEQQAKALELTEKSIEPMGVSLAALSESLLTAQKAVQETDPNAGPLRRFLQDSAAVCRVAADDLVKAGASSRELAARTGRIPAHEERLAALRRPLSQVLDQVAQINDNLDAIVRTTDEKLVSGAARAAAGPAATGVAGVRSALGEAIGRIDSAPRTPAASVARAIERSSAAIVIGPPGSARGGVTSIDLAAIYPPRSIGGAPPQQIDLRARTEELLAGAIASLAKADAPIVVFVHGRNVRLAPEFVPMAPIVDRLRLRGVDFSEWAAGVESAPPSTKAIDPTGQRPVVYVVISMAPNTAEDGARVAKLAAATSSLVGGGKNVLVCAVPSSLPSTGQPDPMVAMLAPLGLEVDTGRPLMRKTIDPRKAMPTVTPDLLLTRVSNDHRLSKSIDALPLLLPWALPIGMRPVAGVSQIEFVQVASDGNTWGEAEFMGFLQIPAAQHPFVTNPPLPGTRDSVSGPWPVVAGVERTVEGARQRIVVVGSNRWMSSEVIGAERVEESRRVLEYPGNMALLQGSVFWLAGQDAMIAASAESRAVATIPPLEPGVITALRWGLVGGLPVLILMFGAIWRLLRG